MLEKDFSIEILNEILLFSRNNSELINWQKFKKEINKLDSQLKKLIFPSEKVKEIFTDKKLFKNLNEIKLFMSKNFNYNIKESTTAGILSNITYFTIKNPKKILEIEDIIKKRVIKPRVLPKEKRITPKKIITPTGETWRDWTSYEPNELKIYLTSLTLTQIKPKLGNLLTSSEKRLKKAILIDTIVKKIKKLKVHYEMGPG